MTQQAVIGTGTQLCTFLADDKLFGVDVTGVQEVIRHQEITPVPLAPKGVSGLINLRGQIVTAIDLRTRLGLRGREDGELPMNVVLRQETGAVSLLVDEIGDVVVVDEAAFEAPPETLEPNAKALVKGVYKLDSQLLLLLNTNLAVKVGNQTSGSNPSEGRDHA